MTLITENSVVRLKKEYADEFPRQYATVVGFISDIEGGVVVTPALEGMRSWNVAQLEIVPSENKEYKWKTNKKRKR